MHTLSPLRRQRGIGFLGLLVVVALGLCVVLVGMQLVPSAIEYQAVRKAVQRASQEVGVPAIRADFDRAATIDDITSLSGKDLIITPVGDGYRVAFDYRKEIHLVGPAYLVMHYTGSSK
ncbi:DUF4845 domain-containing protein [Xylophilus sp. ASV27]|uniref:DUF4845 domain-containing protein n=1 Tax=Xylophilus sp. ASV27 TaxID=2795129 RepID=UPI0018EB0E3E|nr:DUF4845 domain-containing protein [Xylophilus sp. ASV27]